MRKIIRQYALRWLRPLMALGMLATVKTGLGQHADLEEGWTLLSRYLYRDAAEAFALAGDGDARQRDLGLAASLLNEPPVTSGKIDRADELLSGVISGGPEDAYASYARYLQARILHMHRDTPIDVVEKAYREVIAKDTSGGVGQLAASHLALLLIYQRPDLEIPARLAAAAELETVAAGDSLPEVSLGYYRTLADGSLFYEQVTPQVLRWLRQAHDIESSDQLIQIGLSLQIAEVARALGERDTAVRYYQEFLETAVPTDQRYETAKMRMQELEGNQ